MRIVLSTLMLLAFTMPVCGTTRDSGLQSAVALVEHCRSYLTDAASPAGKFCVAYIRGFMAGARGRGWLHIGYAIGSEKTARDWPKRIDPADGALGRNSQSCVAENFSLGELVSKLIEYSSTRADLQMSNTTELLRDMFVTKYPCYVH